MSDYAREKEKELQIYKFCVGDGCVTGQRLNIALQEKKTAGLEKRIDALNGRLEKLKRLVETRGLGEAFAEYLKSLAPKTIKQKLKEAKAEAAEQNRQRADNIRRMPEKEKYQGLEL